MPSDSYEVYVIVLTTRYGKYILETSEYEQL